MTNEELFVQGNETKDINIDFNGKTYPFKIRLLSGYQKDRINSQAAKIDPATKQVDMSIAELHFWYIKEGLAEAPFVINDENIKKLQSDVFSKLADEVYKFNTIEPQLEKK
jgi:hypothetical protein